MAGALKFRFVVYKYYGIAEEYKGSYPLAVVQAHPAIVLFRICLQKSPPGSTSAIRLIDNGEYARTCALSGLLLVRARAFADIQVGCCYLYQEGTSGTSRAGLLSGVNNFSALIIHGTVALKVMVPELLRKPVVSVEAEPLYPPPVME